jgi:hypothetical protein
MEPTAATEPAARHLGSLPGPRRLAVGLFLLSLLGFYALAQVQLAVAVGGGKPLPGPERVLLRYHGDARTRLDRVLDPSLPDTDPKNMSLFLPSEDRPAHRKRILDWVAAGAPREGFTAVATILSNEDHCAFCHSTRPMEGGGTRAKADLPFDTYEQALEVTKKGEGMPLGLLAESSHNHAFAFAVAALLVSMVFSFTRWRGPIVPLLISSAFVGAAIDIASWWLTRSHGSPWQWGVIGGGALFGVSISGMAALSLDEAWAGGRLGGLLAKALGPLRLGRRDPP